MNTRVDERHKFEDNAQFDRKPMKVPNDGGSADRFFDLDQALS